VKIFLRDPSWFYANATYIYYAKRHLVRLRERFLTARDLPANRRPAFLDQSCRGDSALREEIEALLSVERADAGARLGPPIPAVKGWDMPQSNLDRIRGIFLEARRLPAEERAAFLDSACGTDPALRREVDQILAKDRSETLPIGQLAPASENIPSKIGPFTILEILGEGGMGIVYKGEQLAPIRRLVALKVIKPCRGCRSLNLPTSTGSTSASDWSCFSRFAMQLPMPITNW
jgi:hypothetical protein